MPGNQYFVVKWGAALRYLTNYSEIIQWYGGCSFFSKSFLLKNRDRKKKDNVTGDDGKIPKKRCKNLIRKSEIFLDLWY